MAIHFEAPSLRELKPRIIVCGVGGAGGNAVNNMIELKLPGVDFVVMNTDAQALANSKAERIIQMGLRVTEGLGAGSHPEVGRAAAEEALEEIRDHLTGVHMCFVTAGMGGGTGTGAAPVIAQAARELGILTVGVVTKPFTFEGERRMRIADNGIAELQKAVDTLIVVPNQNLFRVANERTTFADAFAMADQVLYSGVACITDLMVKEGLINLDFADVRAIMREMGKAMMGTGEASGEGRAHLAAEAAIANPLLDEVSMRGARGLLISITGGPDLTLCEVDEAATRIRAEVDPEANIILGATIEENLAGKVRVSVVATGIDRSLVQSESEYEESRLVSAASRLRAQVSARAMDPTPLRSAALGVGESEPSSRRETLNLHQDPGGPSESASLHAPLDSLQGHGLAPAASHAAAFAMAQNALREREVHIQPLAQRRAYYPEPDTSPVSSDYSAVEAGPFIPPAPEGPIMRPVRMPEMNDFPLPAQRQLRAASGNPSEVSPAVTHRRGLLERVMSFGLSRQQSAARALSRSSSDLASSPSIKMGSSPTGRPVIPPSAHHPDYAKRGTPSLVAKTAAGQLDAQGRIVPVSGAMDEDRLDIPAFLRRQSN